MADLYLVRYGFINPTIVLYNNDGRIERLETRRLSVEETVSIWRRGFDIPNNKEIVLHCTKKEFNAISGHVQIEGVRSVKELLKEQGVECLADDIPLFFKEYEK